MPDANIIGVPIRTTNKGFTILVLLGMLVLLALLLETLASIGVPIFSLEDRIVTGMTLILIGAFVGAELGARIPKIKKLNRGALKDVSLLVIVALTMLYGFLALGGWAIPELIMWKPYVIAISLGLSLYAFFTK